MHPPLVFIGIDCNTRIIQGKIGMNSRLLKRLSALSTVSLSDSIRAQFET